MHKDLTHYLRGPGFKDHILTKKRLYSFPSGRFLARADKATLLSILDGWGAQIRDISKSDLEIINVPFKDIGWRRAYSLPRADFEVLIDGSNFVCTDWDDLRVLIADLSETRPLMVGKPHRKYERYVLSLSQLRKMNFYHFPFEPTDMIANCVFRSGNDFAMADLSHLPDMGDGLTGSKPFDFKLNSCSGFAVFTALFSRRDFGFKGIIDIGFLGFDMSTFPYSRRRDFIPEPLRVEMQETKHAEPELDSFLIDSEHSLLTLSGYSIYTDKYPAYLIKDTDRYYVRRTDKRGYSGGKPKTVCLAIIQRTEERVSSVATERYKVLEEIVSRRVNPGNDLLKFAVDTQFRRFGFHENNDKKNTEKESWHSDWRKRR